jgi:predicted Rossmann-fold nucleotide-binding protein
MAAKAWQRLEECHAAFNARVELCPRFSGNTIAVEANVNVRVLARHVCADAAACPDRRHERHEAGGHVVGVTMEQFKSAPNPYLKKIEPTADFYARLQILIRESVGYIALRGGMGTVTEISLVWNKLMTRVISPRPLILLGECWPRTIECLREHLVVSQDDLAYLSFAADADEAVALLRQATID